MISKSLQLKTNATMTWLILLVTLTLLGEESLALASQFTFISISTYYESYHNAFTQVKMIKALTSTMCLGQVGRQQENTQTDAAIAFKFDNSTLNCKIGKVPLQLVKFVMELKAMPGFEFKTSTDPEKLYICGNCFKDYTKVAVVGSIEQWVKNEIVDLSSTSSICQTLPNSPYAVWRALTMARHDDNIAACTGVSLSGSLDNCFKLNDGKTNWQQLPSTLDNFRHFGISIQKDFNHFWLLGGFPGPGLSSFVTKTESIKNGVIDPTAETLDLPVQLKDIFHTVCHVQLNPVTQFFAGGLLVSIVQTDQVGLWNIDSGDWTSLPNLALPRQGMACGFFRNAEGDINVVAAGGMNDGVLSKLVDIYDPVRKTKRMGKTIPFNHFGTTNVQFVDHFLAIAGATPSPAVNQGSIYKFDPTLEEFILLPQSVTPRNHQTAMAVPDSLTNC